MPASGWWCSSTPRLHLRVPHRDHRLRRPLRGLRRPATPSCSPAPPTGVRASRPRTHHRDLNKLRIPMLADIKRELTGAPLGILDKNGGGAARDLHRRSAGDPFVYVTDLSVGRSPESAARARRAADRRAVPLQLEVRGEAVLKPPESRRGALRCAHRSAARWPRPPPRGAAVAAPPAPRRRPHSGDDLMTLTELKASLPGYAGTCASISTACSAKWVHRGCRASRSPWSRWRRRSPAPRPAGGGTQRRRRRAGQPAELDGARRCGHHGHEQCVLPVSPTSPATRSTAPCAQVCA